MMLRRFEVLKTSTGKIVFSRGKIVLWDNKYNVYIEGNLYLDG